MATSRILNRPTQSSRAKPLTFLRSMWPRVTLLMVTLCLTSALASQSTALASGRPVLNGNPSHQSAVSPNVSCSGSGCTGKDPYATGCYSGALAQAAYPQYVHNGQIHDANHTYYDAIIMTSNISAGTVELWWSPTCQTNWAEVTDTVAQSPQITASIEGESSRVYWYSRCSGSGCGSPDSKGYHWHSPMYYAPVESTAAYGAVLVGSQSYDNCLTQIFQGVCDHP